MPNGPNPACSRRPTGGCCFSTRSASCRRRSSPRFSPLSTRGRAPASARRGMSWSNVAIIAATNEDLQVAMREKRFREDLYGRLAGGVTLPLAAAAGPRGRHRAPGRALPARACEDYGIPAKTLRLRRPRGAASLCLARERPRAPQRDGARRARAGHERGDRRGPRTTLGRAARSAPRPTTMPATAWSRRSGERTGTSRERRASSGSRGRPCGPVSSGSGSRPPGNSSDDWPTLSEEPPDRRVLAAARSGSPRPRPPRHTAGRPGHGRRTDLSARRGASPPVLQAAVRWDPRRRVTLLRAQITSDSARFRSPPATRVLVGLVERVRSFGGRIEDLGVGGLVAAFGLGPGSGRRPPCRARWSRHREGLPARAGRGAPGHRNSRSAVAIHVTRMFVAEVAGTATIDADARAAGVGDPRRAGASGGEGLAVSESAALFLGRHFEIVRQAEQGAWPPVWSGRAPTAARFAPTGLSGPRPGSWPSCSALRRAPPRASRLVSIIGNPGIGKSRLVHEFVQGLAPDAVALLRGAMPVVCERGAVPPGSRRAPRRVRCPGRGIPPTRSRPRPARFSSAWAGSAPWAPYGPATSSVRARTSVSAVERPPPGDEGRHVRGAPATRAPRARAPSTNTN